MLLKIYSSPSVPFFHLKEKERKTVTAWLSLRVKIESLSPKPSSRLEYVRWDVNVWTGYGTCEWGIRKHINAQSRGDPKLDWGIYLESILPSYVFLKENPALTLENWWIRMRTESSSLSSPEGGRCELKGYSWEVRVGLHASTRAWLWQLILISKGGPFSQLSW